MYKTNLSWTTLQEMFNTLIERGFIQIETNGKTKVYSVTEKGKRALGYHQKSLEGLIKPEETLRNPLFVNMST
jgi:predicted transcriptional regulator